MIAADPYTQAVSQTGLGAIGCLSAFAPFFLPWCRMGTLLRMLLRTFLLRSFLHMLLRLLCLWWARCLHAWLLRMRHRLLWYRLELWRLRTRLLLHLLLHLLMHLRLRIHLRCGWLIVNAWFRT